MPIIKRFVVLGDTGAGKSSFINACFNYCYGTRDDSSVFDSDEPAIKLAIPCQGWDDLVDKDHASNRSSERNIGDQTISQTTCCTRYILKYDNDYIVELIDTPGFNDTNGMANDESNLQEIEQALRTIPYLSGLIIVLNGSTARIGVSFEHFLHLLHDVWPNSLMNSVCAVLTNCDDVGCNLKPEKLRKILNVNNRTTFHIQNSLFRWNRANRTPKSLRTFRREFEDVIDTLTKLFPVLFSFEDVSTNAFKVGAIKQLLIDKCISESIDKMVESLRMYRLRRIANAGIEGAEKTMSENKNWEKVGQITAFKWMEVEPSDSYRRNDLRNGQNNSSFTGLYEKPLRPSTIDDAHSSRGDRKFLSYSESHNSETHVKRSSPQRILFSSTNEKQASLYRTDISSSRPTGQTCTTSQSHCSSRSTSASIDDYHDCSSNKSTHTAGSSSSGMNNNDNSDFSTSRQAPKYRTEEFKIQVILPDNEAISHHEVARKQVNFLRKKDNEIQDKQVELRIEMVSLLEKLKSDVDDMRMINNYIDLLEKNKNVLNNFRDEIKLGGDLPEMLMYYDETVRILSMQSIKRGDATEAVNGNCQ